MKPTITRLKANEKQTQRATYKFICRRCKKEKTSSSGNKLYCSICIKLRTLERHKERDKKRFASKYPLMKKRAEIANFFLSKINNEFLNFDKQIKFTNYLTIKIPFNPYLSKNRLGFYQGRVFILKETRENQDLIGYLIKAKNHKFYQGKIFMDLYIEQPTFRNDAINFIDRIADAAKKVVGFDDRWFCIRRVDWNIVKDDPQIYIGLGQTITEDYNVCSLCGRYLPVNPYFIKLRNKTIYQNCKSCRSKKVDELKY